MSANRARFRAQKTDPVSSASGASYDEQRRLGLSRNRMLATGLLAVMGGVYIGTHFVSPTFAVLLIRAGAEAGLVGGLADWFAVPRLADVLPVVALALPLTACSVVSDSLLRKRLALDRVSQAEMIGLGAALPVTLLCAIAGLGVWALVAGWLVNSAGRTIAVIAFAPWRPGWRVGGGRAKEMLHFSLATFGVEILWTLRVQADALVVGKITGPAILGLYSMAKELALSPGSKISAVVNMLSPPLMAELQTNVDAMREAFYHSVRLTAAIALPASVGMALVAEEMIAALLGTKWLPAIPILRLLCFYAAIRTIEPLLTPVLLARHRQRFLFYYYLVQVIVVPAAAVMGALWDGAVGAVLLSAPVYGAFTAVMAKETLAELKGGISELWAQTWPLVAAAAAMAVAVLLLQEFLPGLALPPFSALILLAASGAVTYGVALLAVGTPVIRDGIEVAGWVLGRYRVDRG